MASRKDIVEANELFRSLPLHYDNRELFIHGFEQGVMAGLNPVEDFSEDATFSTLEEIGKVADRFDPDADKLAFCLGAVYGVFHSKNRQGVAHV